MLEKENLTQGKFELDFTFLEDVTFEDLVGGLHLFNHVVDHRKNPEIKIDEIAFILDSTPEHIGIAQRIISEVEKVGRENYHKISQKIINKAIIGAFDIVNSRFLNYLKRESISESSISS